MTAPLFFTFMDGSLSYDCPSCGAECCKGNGVALDAERELVRFARLSPRAAALFRPLGARLAEPIDGRDGCSQLEPDGRCGVELEHGRAAKPAVCRLFPFNRLFAVEGALVVDVNSRLCPVADAADSRSGECWSRLADELAAEPLTARLALPKAPPARGRELGWLEHEALVRDAARDHLAEPDYAAYAAFQEEAVLSLARGAPLLPPGAPELLSRTQRLRALLGRYRALFGSEGAPGLPAAARAAARQAALLTCSWRMGWLLRDGAESYPVELQRLPRQLLAATALIELGLLARRRTPGLRGAPETRLGTLPLTTLLGFYDHQLRLVRPLAVLGVAEELRPPLEALSAALHRGGKPFGALVESALSPHPPHVRGLAFSWFANGDAQLEAVA